MTIWNFECKGTKARRNFISNSITCVYLWKLHHYYVYMNWILQVDKQQNCLREHPLYILRCVQACWESSKPWRITGVACWHRSWSLFLRWPLYCNHACCPLSRSQISGMPHVPQPKGQWLWLHLLHACGQSIHTRRAVSAGWQCLPGLTDKEAVTNNKYTVHTGRTYLGFQ